jgi:lysophospholipase L1-like esterase
MRARRNLAELVTIACALVLVASTAAAEPTRYPAGPVHSPMTPAVVARLKGVLAASGGARDAFVKIGDSNTANPGFLNCFAGKDVSLGEHGSLEATRAFFGGRKVDGAHVSFDRTSTSATIGWLAGQPLQGAPSHLAGEVAAVKPAFAVIMLGTNDDRAGGYEAFVKNLHAVVDTTLALGVVPLVSTLPPRDDDPHAGARIPEMNRAIRALAESRQIPLMDLNAALLPLPRHGLVSDGIHLASYWQDNAPHACRLTGPALQKGMNVRNLLVLEALDRARRFVVENESPESAPVPGT